MLKDTVAVESYSGEGAYGPIYAASATVSCNIDGTRRLVRNANGDEVVSEATLHVHPNDAAAFVPESRVTISGRASTVLSVNSQTFRGQAVYAKVTCS
jgi:hypothetical protein